MTIISKPNHPKRCIIIGGKLKNSIFPKEDKYALCAIMREFNRCDQITLGELIYMWKLESDFQVLFEKHSLKITGDVKQKVKEQIVEIVKA